MADIAWTDVTDLQANLDAVSEGWQTVILGYVNSEISSRIFGGDDSYRFHMARVFLAAHFGELQRRKDASAGAVTSETIGTSSISISYAALTDAGLRQTQWGAQYLDFVRMSPWRIGGGVQS